MSKEKVKKPFYKKWWVWVLAIIIIGAISTSGEDAANTNKAKDSNSKEASTSEKKSFKIGQKVTVGKLIYKANGVKETTKISNVLGDKTTSGKFVIVNLTITNKDKESRLADAEMFKIKTSDGTEYSADAELDLYVNEDGMGFFLEDINPNIAKQGSIVFELPADAKNYNLEVSSGFGWAGGEYETIKLK